MAPQRLQLCEARRQTTYHFHPYPREGHARVCCLLLYQKAQVFVNGKHLSLYRALAYPLQIKRPANKSQVEISDFLGRQKGNTKSSR